MKAGKAAPLPRSVKGCSLAVYQFRIPYYRIVAQFITGIVADATVSLDRDAIGGAPDAMKRKTLEGFGTRLAAIRQSRGLTQTELGKAACVSQRVIAY